MVEVSSGSRQCISRDVEVFKTACAICPWCCGLDVYVKEGKIIKISGMAEHPWSRGMTCIKSRSMIDTIYSERRLRYPLKKVNGEWQRVSWEQAFDTIADKLKQVKETYGAKALATFVGDASALGSFLNVELAQRFCQIYGTPNWFTPGSHCINQVMTASILMFGRFNCQLPEVQHSKCIIAWGNNPTSSIPVLSNFLVQAKERGAKLIVIDPRYTYLAKKADIYTPIRPGTDCALALGMLNVVISEELYDKEFVEKWTFGFDKLAERVRDYPPERAAEITQIPAETIRELARTYASIKPASISYGINSLGHCASGFYTYQAIFGLQVITGNFGLRGGFNLMLVPPQMPRILRLPEMMRERPLGADRFPIIHEIGSFIPGGEGQSMLLADAILTGKPHPIKAIITMGNNLMHELPNNNKTREALKKLDFLVVVDIFMSETAAMADLVLPACTYFEREDILDLYGLNHGIPYTILRKKAIEPLGESLPDGEIWLRLGKKIYPEYFPWKNMEELYDFVYEPRGLSCKSLREETPEGVYWGSMPVNYKKYEEDGFATPSGKIELYSERLKNLGYDPLSFYTEPTEGPGGDRELVKEYPIMLFTGARPMEFYHSQFRDVPRLRRSNPESRADIHPDMAKKYGISDGEMIIIETKRGSLEIKARVTEDIYPEVVSIPHGWEPNVNVLTSEKPEDPLFGFPGLKTVMGRIRKKM